VFRTDAQSTVKLLAWIFTELKLHVFKMLSRLDSPNDLNLNSLMISSSLSA